VDLDQHFSAAQSRQIENGRLKIENEAARSQSSIFNLQSSIFNLQFSIFNFQSSIFNLLRPRLCSLLVDCSFFFDLCG